MIILKTPDEIEIMARASRLVAETLAMLRREVRAGITTEDLDRLAEHFIRSHGGTPAFKGYRNYPKTLCASINDQVVHGIPSKRALKDGDIIGLDLGAVNVDRLDAQLQTLRNLAGAPRLADELEDLQLPGRQTPDR